MSMKNKSLEDVQPEYLAIILSLHDEAFTRMADPDFIRVLPPPEDKTPGSLIYAWGIEMLRLGFELGVELLSDTQERTDKEDIKK